MNEHKSHEEMYTPMPTSMVGNMKQTNIDEGREPMAMASSMDLTSSLTERLNQPPTQEQRAEYTHKLLDPTRRNWNENSLHHYRDAVISHLHSDPIHFLVHVDFFNLLVDQTNVGSHCELPMFVLLWYAIVTDTQLAQSKFDRLLMQRIENDIQRGVKVVDEKRFRHANGTRHHIFAILYLYLRDVPQLDEVIGGWFCELLEKLCNDPEVLSAILEQAFPSWIDTSILEQRESMPGAIRLATLALRKGYRALPPVLLHTWIAKSQLTILSQMLCDLPTDLLRCLPADYEMVEFAIECAARNPDHAPAYEIALLITQLHHWLEAHPPNSFLNFLAPWTPIDTLVHERLQKQLNTVLHPPYNDNWATEVHHKARGMETLPTRIKHDLDNDPQHDVAERDITSWFRHRRDHPSNAISSHQIFRSFDLARIATQLSQNALCLWERKHPYPTTDSIQILEEILTYRQLHPDAFDGMEEDLIRAMESAERQRPGFLELKIWLMNSLDSDAFWEHPFTRRLLLLLLHSQTLGLNGEWPTLKRYLCSLVRSSKQVQGGSTWKKVKVWCPAGMKCLMPMVLPPGSLESAVPGVSRLIFIHLVEQLIVQLVPDLQKSAWSWWLSSPWCREEVCWPGGIFQRGLPTGGLSAMHFTPEMIQNLRDAVPEAAADAKIRILSSTSLSSDVIDGIVLPYLAI